MKIYLASSWRNKFFDSTYALLSETHNVYNFKDPKNSFTWDEIDAYWETWTTNQFKSALTFPSAVKGFNADFKAMQNADICILVQPCGRSAHIELGWCAGAGKKTAILIPDQIEPELMFNMVDFICSSLIDLRNWLNNLEEKKNDPS